MIVSVTREHARIIVMFYLTHLSHQVGNVDELLRSVTPRYHNLDLCRTATDRLNHL